MKNKFPINYKIKKVSIDQLFKFYDFETIKSYCKSCPNYCKIWTCPQLEFDPQLFLKQFNYAYIISAKVYSEDLNVQIKSFIENEKNASEITNYIYEKGRSVFDEKMFSLEDIYEGSISLMAGRCLLCDQCERIYNRPCKKPDKLRYSLESLGIEVSKVTETFLNEKILWSNDTLPEYTLLVSALLTKEEVQLETL